MPRPTSGPRWPTAGWCSSPRVTSGARRSSRSGSPQRSCSLPGCPGRGSVDLPAAPYVHLFVARGAATLRIGARRVDLAAGDAVVVRPSDRGAGPLPTAGTGRRRGAGLGDDPGCAPRLTDRLCVRPRGSSALPGSSATAWTSSSWYFSIASAGASCLTSPRRASSVSAATVIDSASTWKWRRSAGRVSDRPKPSVPSDAQSCGHPRPDLVRHRAHPVADRDDRAGRAVQLAGHVRHPGASSGCSRFQLVAGSGASRRSSVQDVARPHVGGHAPVLGEQPLRVQRPVDRRAARRAAAPAAGRRCRGHRSGAGGVAVEPAQDALLQVGHVRRRGCWTFGSL